MAPSSSAGPLQWAGQEDAQDDPVPYLPAPGGQTPGTPFDAVYGASMLPRQLIVGSPYVTGMPLPQMVYPVSGPRASYPFLPGTAAAGYYVLPTPHAFAASRSGKSSRHPSGLKLLLRHPSGDPHLVGSSFSSIKSRGSKQPTGTTSTDISAASSIESLLKETNAGMLTDTIVPRSVVITPLGPDVLLLLVLAELRGFGPFESCLLESCVEESVDDTPPKEYTTVTLLLLNLFAARELYRHVKAHRGELSAKWGADEVGVVAPVDAAAHPSPTGLITSLSSTVNGTRPGLLLRTNIVSSLEVSPAVRHAVLHAHALRCLVVMLPSGTSSDALRKELSLVGAIDLIEESKEDTGEDATPQTRVLVHFFSIQHALDARERLASHTEYLDVRFGRDNSSQEEPGASGFSSPEQSVASMEYQRNGVFNGTPMVPGTPVFGSLVPGVYEGVPEGYVYSTLQNKTAAAATVVTAAGGQENLGNRTIYLGNLHQDTRVDELCNVVRGGLLHHIKHFPLKHMCFITFVDPMAAAQFFASATMHNLVVHGKRVKVGWGRHLGPVPNSVQLAVTAGALRNVYIGLRTPAEGGKLPLEEQVRADFAVYGDTEQINYFGNHTCMFVNFLSISCAIRLVDDYQRVCLGEKAEKGDEATAMLQKYAAYRVAFGKDRCGNPPKPRKRKTKSTALGRGSGDDTAWSVANSLMVDDTFASLGITRRGTNGLFSGDIRQLELGAADIKQSSPLPVLESTPVIPDLPEFQFDGYDSGSEFGLNDLVSIVVGPDHADFVQLLQADTSASRGPLLLPAARHARRRHVRPAEALFFPPYPAYPGHPFLPPMVRPVFAGAMLDPSVGTALAMLGLQVMAQYLSQIQHDPLLYAAAVLGTPSVHHPPREPRPN